RGLYIRDLRGGFPPVELGPDGRFGYRRLPLYWSEPDRHFAFLIRCAGRIGGFVLVTRGSPVASDPDVLHLGEFLVVPNYRRAGVGRQPASLLWDRHPGKWIVRVLETNRGALAFWRDTVASFTAGSFDESSWRRPPNDGRVFAFESGTATDA